MSNFDEEINFLLEWIAKNPELAKKHYPGYVLLMNEVIMESPPYIMANIIQSLPENFKKWQNEIETSLPSTKRKKIKEYIETLDVVLDGYYPKTEIVREAVNSVERELIEMRKYFKAQRLQTNSDNNLHQHINWLKSDESREQFIEALKEHNLIEARETETIINNHFKAQREQYGKPEPIIWLDSNTQRVLVYLFRKLFNNYFISPNPDGKKWQMVSEHFIKENREYLNFRSLTQEAHSQKDGSLPANGTNTIDKIIDRLTAG